MTPYEVAMAVSEIRRLAAAGDDEQAHRAEDALYRRLVRALAEGRIEEARECARTAISTQELAFDRWCS